MSEILQQVGQLTLTESRITRQELEREIYRAGSRTFFYREALQAAIQGGDGYIKIAPSEIAVYELSQPTMAKDIASELGWPETSIELDFYQRFDVVRQDTWPLLADGSSNVFFSVRFTEYGFKTVTIDVSYQVWPESFLTRAGQEWRYWVELMEERASRYRAGSRIFVPAR